MVRVLHKQHGSVDATMSTVQPAAGIMVWAMFSWHTLSLLTLIKHHLNATALLSIVADYVQ